MPAQCGCSESPHPARGARGWRGAVRVHAAGGRDEAAWLVMVLGALPVDAAELAGLRGQGCPRRVGKAHNDEHPKNGPWLKLRLLRRMFLAKRAHSRLDS